MKQCRIFLGLFYIMIMTINIVADEWLNGNVRLGYQNHQIKSASSDELALGVMLHAQKPLFDGVEVGGSLWSSLGKGEPQSEGIAFFDENHQSYAILGEAYLKVTLGNSLLTLGRQSFDTPFADSDDIGMVQNSFEAVTLVNTDIPQTTVFLSHVQKWAGVDSPTQKSFGNLNEDKGMDIVGIAYAGIPNLTIESWFYHLSEVVNLYYLESSYQTQSERFEYEVKLQYAYQDYTNGEYSAIVGGVVSLGLKESGVKGSIAYNRVKGISADNFFGGGPFFTNAQHNTLREAGANGNIILYTLEYNGENIGMEEWSITTNIDAHHGNAYRAREYDVSVVYQYDEKSSLSLIYSHIEDRETSFQNLRLFANYAF